MNYEYANKGLWYVADLLFENSFASQEDMLRNYNIDFNFLKWFTFRHSLPKQWREALKANDFNLPQEVMMLPYPNSKGEIIDY